MAQRKAGPLPGAQRGGRALWRSKMGACLMKEAGLPLPEPELKRRQESSALV